VEPEDIRQLTLGVGLREGHDFQNFVTGRNATAVAALKAIFDSTIAPLVYLWGGAGSGKTHLLEALCAAAGDRASRAAYLPLMRRAGFDPAILSGLEAADLVCLDDIHAVAGDTIWEEALFHLYNRLDAARAPLVVTAASAPLKTGWQLKDLASRLASGATYEIFPLNDNERAQVLRQTARARGFGFPDEAVRYVLHREVRDMHTLMAILDELDKLSLAHQRMVTIPLVREVLSRRRG
jgi:DnaA family protein